MIWQRIATVEQVNARLAGCMPGLLGITITEIGPDFLAATMPVDQRHAQPFGVLHGGASVVLGETLGSAACNLMQAEGFGSVGIEVNANHVASVKVGQTLTAICRPIHTGRQIQVWQTEIRRADGKLAAICRLTCQVIPL
jgi:1,4-dihydroxy-2-naphthoyl-CoA hydrolase